MYVGGGGFYLDKGKLITWGSTDDEGQSYVASGKHVVKFFKIIVYLVSSLTFFVMKFVPILFLFLNSIG